MNWQSKERGSAAQFGPAVLGRYRAWRLASNCQRWCAKAVLVAIVALHSPSLTAQVHKCVNAQGKVEFSDQPCSADSKGGRVQVEPNIIDSSGLREQALKAENQRLRDQLAAQEAAERTSRLLKNLAAGERSSPGSRVGFHDFRDAGRKV